MNWRWVFLPAGILLIGLGFIVGAQLTESWRSHGQVEKTISDPTSTDQTIQLGIDYQEKELSISQPASEPTTPKPSHLDQKNSPYSILIVGIDRRYSAETSYRTDVILVITLSSDRQKVLLTSIPRDLWAGSERINALYTVEGVEALKQAIWEATSLSIDNYIRVDFDAFVWAIDAVGGIELTVTRGFTDSTYPDDRQGNPGVIEVIFPEGKQTLDGETALIYARSRKGSNGEGSDFARMHRQHEILKVLPAAFFSPRCIFNPFLLKDFYDTVADHVRTNLSIADVGILYELLKTYREVGVESVVIDPQYLTVPPAEDYGGAYVLVPQDGDYSPIHQLIQSKIN